MSFNRVQIVYFKSVDSLKKLMCKTNPYYQLRDLVGKSAILQEVIKDKLPWFVNLQTVPSESRVDLLKVVNKDILAKIKKTHKGVEFCSPQMVRNIEVLEKVAKDLIAKQEKAEKEKATKTKEKKTDKKKAPADSKNPVKSTKKS